jgi:putative (di)nucleoside polyphosphate hydrolase
MSRDVDIVNNPDYRANVGIMLINKDHNVMAGEAYHYPGEWMMPQGGIDAGESPLQAMKRELVEETGISFNDTSLIHEHHKWLSYRLSRPLEKNGIVYLGQRQKWFLLEFDGPPPDAELARDREFRRFDWVKPLWLVERAARFKIDLYRDVFAVFEEYFP